MSIKNIFFLTLILSVLMISCIPSDKSIGEQFISGDYIMKVDTATFALNITNKMPDSIQAYSSSYMMVGYLADPTFGITSSASAFQIIPSPKPDDDGNAINIDLGDEYRVKSISLNLVRGDVTNYSDKYDGIAQNIYVYKLKKAIDTTNLSLFNTSFTTGDFNSTPIHLGAPVYYGGESIEIFLSNEFGEEVLAISKEDFLDAKEFTKKIKGLYITTDTPDQLNEGGRLNYLSIEYSYVSVIYYMTDAEVTDKEVTAYFSLGYGYARNQIKSGSPLKDAPRNPQKIVYIDGLAGIKPYLSGADLKAQLDDWMKTKGYNKNSVVLSRAIINLPFEMPTDDYEDVTNRYPQTIYPCTINSTTKYFTPLKDIGYSYFYTDAKKNSVNINRSLMLYPCDVTRYIQDLIKKDPTEVNSSDDLWFSPILNALGDEYGQQVLSLIFDSQDYKNGILNGPLAEKNPTLSLVFTVIE